MSFSGVLFSLLFVILFFALMIYFLVMERKGRKTILRRLAAFSLQEKTIKQAVEDGKGIHLSLGWGKLDDLQGGSGLAGLDLLERISGTASLGDQPPIATSGNGTLMILSQEVLKETYNKIGANSAYQPKYAQLTGLTPFSYASGVLPIIRDHDIAANFYFGHYGAEIGLLTDASEQSGSVTIGGSDEINAQAVLFASAQEPLIGEELYSIGAYIHPKRINIASLKAQDVMRWLIVSFILIGVLLKLAGVI